jgi:tetratricopeptide (TPR) repeat protein
VHYLHNRAGDYPPLGASWADYLRRLESGQSRSAAFADAFSVDLDTLTQKMKKYANGGRYNYSRTEIDKLVPHFSPQATSMSQTEVQMELGQFSLRTEDADSAASWFSKVIAADADNAHAISGLASALALGEDFDGAKEQFQNALTMEPDDPDILLNYALFKLQQASSPDTWFTRSDHLESAEKMLLKARSIMGGTVEIDTYLASIWQNEDGASVPALKLLETVISRAPTEQWPMLMLAEGLEQVGQTNDAITIARLIIQYDHDGSIYSIRAQRLIDNIQSPTAPEPEPPQTD